MSGHGCPPNRRRPSGRARLIGCIWALALPLAAALCAPAARGKDVDIRLRIAWGGGESRSWQGTIGLNQGTISETKPLGLEPDEPGSMLLVDPATLRVHPRTPRNYDGCDLQIQAQDDAKLILQLWPTDGLAGEPVEIHLSRLTKGFVQIDLDDRGNRLLAQRSPGDSIRVKLARDALIFTPGETVELEVEPSALEVTAGASYLLAISLGPPRSDQQLWNQDYEVRVDANGQPSPIALQIPLPQTEGVYDVRLALFPKRLTTTLVRGKPLAARKVQLIALAPVKPANNSAAAWQSVLEFDPASHRWWERLARLPTWPRLPNLPQPSPSGVASGPAATRNHLGRPWVELAPKAWHAYPLAVSTPGVPHILEVEYPSDLEQTLAISLIEPNAAGKVAPIGLDSGLDVPAKEAGHQAQVRKHRLTFWPQTRTPYVLLVNRRDNQPAVFGKINILAGPAELPALTIAEPSFGARTLAAFYDKPLVPENFSATEALDPASGRTFKDWQTFYEAGQRLVQTLQHGGYNAVVLTVACRGSTIYPSQLLEPTPEYDTGVFFDSGQDPLRKDVLELLMRLCDRSGIKLIPAVQFSTPLPQLEAIRQAGGPTAVGLEPLGPDGRTWMERYGPRGGQGVYYNALDPRVQQGMLAVVNELVERYGQHVSFGGIAIHLGNESFSLLPDETCSYDDATIDRFLKDTKQELSLPRFDPTPPQLFAARAEFLSGRGAQAWLTWRSSQLTEMFQHMRDSVTQNRADARLYLTGGELFGSQRIRIAMRPMLPPKDDPAVLLPLLGLNLDRLAAEDIVVPRPQRIVPAASAATRDLDRYWNMRPSLDAAFRTEGQRAALHFLEPQPLALPDFDAASPFGADKTRTLLISQVLPADAAQRERFVRSLATFDASLIMDGGWMLPLGQNSALAPLVKVFRRLPAEPFTAAQPAPMTVPPSEVVVRTLAKNGTTYFYALNTTPWPLKARLVFQAPQSIRLTSYADERRASLEQQPGRATWTVEMEPFDLVGGEIAGAQVQVVDWQATPPNEAAESLRERIRQVGLRANALAGAFRSAPPPLLVNPSFEAPPQGGVAVPGWVSAKDVSERREEVLVEVDRQQGSGTPSSLHMASQPNAAGQSPIAWVRSEPMTPRPTGRLQVIAWIRVTDPARQPKLRLAVEGKLDGQTYYRRANVGASESAGGPPITPLTTNWTDYHLVLDDLPVSGLTDLRVGFDLMGEGEVWIDNVQVYDLWFEPRERDDLLNSVLTANVQLSRGELVEAQAFAESYWPSFLRQHVPLPAGSPTNQRPATTSAARPPARPAASAWDQFKGWMPSLPKWR